MHAKPNRDCTHPFLLLLWPVSPRNVDLPTHLALGLSMLSPPWRPPYRVAVATLHRLTGRTRCWLFHHVLVCGVLVYLPFARARLLTIFAAARQSFGCRQVRRT